MLTIEALELNSIYLDNPMIGFQLIGRFQASQGESRFGWMDGLQPALIAFDKQQGRAEMASMTD